MRIAIIGAGGVGGYFGGVLARHGEDVWFLARGANLAALQRHGLCVDTPDTSFTVPVQATAQPSDVGRPKLVLLCVKTYDTDAALQEYRELLQRSATVLSLQNGGHNVERIAAVVGSERVLGGVAYLESVLAAPGHVVVRSALRRIDFGELSGATTERATRILQTLRAAGIDIHLVPNIQEVVWRKFLLISGMSALTALTAGTVGQVRSFPPTRHLLEAVLREGLEVAAARGVKVPATYPEETLHFIDALAYGMKTSLQRDFEAQRPSELEGQLGAVVRLGRAHGVPTPVSQVINVCLGLQEAVHRGHVPTS